MWFTIYNGRLIVWGPSQVWFDSQTSVFGLLSNVKMKKMSKTEWKKCQQKMELYCKQNCCSLFFTGVKVMRLLGINPTKMRSSPLRNFCLWCTVVVVYLIFFNNKATTTTTATTTIFSFCHIRINLTSSYQKLWDGRDGQQVNSHLFRFYELIV